MKPNKRMVDILTENKCKCLYREDGPYTYLWVNYSAAVPKVTGLESWGNATQILDKVKSVVFKFYPAAEITAQAGNKNVTFHLNA